MGDYLERNTRDSSVTLLGDMLHVGLEIADSAIWLQPCLPMENIFSPGPHVYISDRLRLIMAPLNSSFDNWSECALLCDQLLQKIISNYFHAFKILLCKKKFFKLVGSKNPIFHQQLWLIMSCHEKDMTCLRKKKNSPSWLMRHHFFCFSLYLAMDHVPTCMYLMSEPNKQMK